MGLRKYCTYTYGKCGSKVVKVIISGTDVGGCSHKQCRLGSCSYWQAVNVTACSYKKCGRGCVRV